MLAQFYKRSTEDFPTHQKGSTGKLPKNFCISAHLEKALIAQPPKEMNREKTFYYCLLLETLKRKKRISFLEIMHHTYSFSKNRNSEKSISRLDRYKIILHNRFSHTPRVLRCLFFTKKLFEEVMDLRILYLKGVQNTICRSSLYLWD